MTKKYAAVLNHKSIGEIHVCWTDEPLIIKAINVNEFFEDAEYSSSDCVKMRFPDIFELLINYGEKDVYFPIECLDFSDSSLFYRTVYRKLYEVKVGQRVTYGELAAMSGSPNACRAVGSAMRKNKHLLAIPCHRVVGKGYLGNFAKGMELKKKLLHLERWAVLSEKKTI